MTDSNSTPRARRDFSCADVLKILQYDPASGVFVWLIETKGYAGKIRPGDTAGTLKDDYCVICLHKKQYRAHHLAWLVMTGEWPPVGVDVDHADRNRANNAWGNLRLATRGQNNVNTNGRSNNKSGCIGVSFRKDIGKWHARIGVPGKIVLLGNFENLNDAVAARKYAEVISYGVFSTSHK